VVTCLFIFSSFSGLYNTYVMAVFNLYIFIFLYTYCDFKVLDLMRRTDVYNIITYTPHNIVRKYVFEQKINIGTEQR